MLQKKVVLCNLWTKGCPLSVVRCPRSNLGFSKEKERSNTNTLVFFSKSFFINPKDHKKGVKKNTLVFFFQKKEKQKVFCFSLGFFLENQSVCCALQPLCFSIEKHFLRSNSPLFLTKNKHFPWSFGKKPLFFKKDHN